MPTLTPDPQFLHAAAFVEQIDDVARIRLYGIRLYDLNVSLVQAEEFQIAFQIGHGFCAADQIVQDFLDFATLFAQSLPLKISKGTALPMANFMNSPFTNIQYHTFEADYFLKKVEQYPRVHIDTGVEWLELAIWNQLVVDCVIEYQLSPVRKHPLPIPYNHVRQLASDGWCYDLPVVSSYGQGNLTAFERREYPSYNEYYCYVDSIQLWDGVPFTEEQQEDSALFLRHGIKVVEPNPRPMYYGNDIYPYNPDFPYLSIEPIPETSREMEVTYGFGSVDGVWHYLVSPYLLQMYPPESDTPDDPVAIPQLPGVAIGILQIAFSFPTIFPILKLWSKKLDGTWRVGYGGHKL